MGSLRRGLIAACLMPSAAWADACDKTRPAWDGTPVGPFREMVFLFSSPLALLLIFGSMLAVRFCHHWGALLMVVLWTLMVTMVLVTDPTGLQELALTEGCVGSPTLFIAVVTAICVGMILYTSRRA